MKGKEMVREREAERQRDRYRERVIGRSAKVLKQIKEKENKLIMKMEEKRKIC